MKANLNFIYLLKHNGEQTDSHLSTNVWENKPSKNQTGNKCKSNFL